jgi:hypothetical protein
MFKLIMGPEKNSSVNESGSLELCTNMLYNKLELENIKSRKNMLDERAGLFGKVFKYGVLGMFGAFLITGEAIAQKAPKIQFFGEASVAFNFGSCQVKVNNIPEYMRYVPIHKDDGGDHPGNNNGVIPDGVNLRNKADLGDVRFGVNLSLIEYKLNFKAGIGFDIGSGFEFAYDIMNMRAEFPPNRQERNYTSAPGTAKRGYGAALTFYQIDYTSLVKWNTTVLTNAFSEVQIAADKFNVRIGYKVSFEKITLKGGWDRYDALEVRRGGHRYNLADIITGRPYITIDFYNPNIENFTNPRLTIGFMHLINLHKRNDDVNMKYTPGFFIGYSMVIPDNGPLSGILPDKSKK